MLSDDNQPYTISVVVPVFNGAKTIRSSIEHLCNQSMAPIEIIVVNDGSTDETAQILSGFGERIRLLSKTNGGPASARNLGILAATGALIAFTDSDCFPEKNWLEELVKGFHHPRIAGVGGSVRKAVRGLIAEYTDLTGYLNPAFAPGGRVRCLVTANACFRRQALIQANLFDERFTKPGGEDTELSVRLGRLGYEFAYRDNAVVLHRHRTTIGAFLKTASNYGEGWYLLEVLWPEQKWEPRSSGRMIRSAIAARSMYRFYRVYRKQFDRKRSLFFSFMDHYQHVAQSWGYLRGKRNYSLRSQLTPLAPIPTDRLRYNERANRFDELFEDLMLRGHDVDLGVPPSRSAATE